MENMQKDSINDSAFAQQVKHKVLLVHEGSWWSVSGSCTQQKWADPIRPALFRLHRRLCRGGTASGRVCQTTTHRLSVSCRTYLCTRWIPCLSQWGTRKPVCWSFRVKKWEGPLRLYSSCGTSGLSYWCCDPKGFLDSGLPFNNEQERIVPETLFMIFFIYLVTLLYQLAHLKWWTKLQPT